MLRQTEIVLRRRSCHLKKPSVRARRSAPPGTRKSLMLPAMAAGGILLLVMSDIVSPCFPTFFCRWGHLGCRSLIFGLFALPYRGVAGLVDKVVKRWCLFNLHLLLTLTIRLGRCDGKRPQRRTESVRL